MTRAPGDADTGGGMLQEWGRLVRRLVIALDAAVLAATFLAACVARSALYDAPLRELIENHLWLLWVIVPTWVVALELVGLYESLRFRSYGELVKRLAVAHAGASVTLLSVLFLSHAFEVSRLVVQGFVALSFALLVAEKIGLRLVARQVRARGRNARNVLVVGTNGLSARYLRSLERHPFWGLRVMGCLAEDDGGDGVHEDGPAPVLGSIRDLRACLMAWPVDEVAFAVPAGWASVGPAVHTCLEKGVTARVVLDTPEAWRGRASVEMLDDLPVLSYQTTPPPSAAMVAKRCIDVVGALVGLLACVVAYCTFGRRIRRASGGPVMFRQTRIGQNGRPFTLYKFRTMRMGAETERSALVAANAMQGPLFKVRDDPRVTPVGRMLRARYLDELPQFWNVLRGDMSLVGTRPPTPDEVARYDLRHHARLAWRPGLTGMWQVKGNGAVRSFEDVLRLDREYVENWSLRLDLAILARTVRKVLHAEGW